MKPTEHNHSGFTLIEAAIVMIIIGLIAGAIVIGQDMMRSAKLQKVAADFTRFSDATKLFKDKYNYVPGDMATAEDYWGTRANCGTDTTFESRAEATCNGDGDGYITGFDATGADQGADYHESLYAWQHLSNAKLIEGAYSGGPSPNTTWYEPSLNIPKGIDDNEGFVLSYQVPGATLYSENFPGWGVVYGHTFEAAYGHIIAYAVATGTAKDKIPIDFALSNSEAREVDEKIDDGKPASGRLITLYYTQDGIDVFCSTTNSTLTAEYQPKGSWIGDQPACALILQIDYQNI